MEVCEVLGDVRPGLSSYGLKATPLSWATKANCGARTILVLGHQHYLLCWLQMSAGCQMP